MAVFRSQLITLERMIWGFSVFDILSTLLLNFHGALQIFILKKPHPNPPQSIFSAAFAAEASHVTFRGELGDANLFFYSFIFGSI